MLTRVLQVAAVIAIAADCLLNGSQFTLMHRVTYEMVLLGILANIIRTLPQKTGA